MKILPFFLAVSLTQASVLLAQASRPNILVIVSDDQGYVDAGFQGGKDVHSRDGVKRWLRRSSWAPVSKTKIGDLAAQTKKIIRMQPNEKTRKKNDSA